MLRSHAAWRHDSFVHRLTVAIDSNELGKFVGLDSRVHLIMIVLDALGIRSRLGERQDELISVIGSTLWSVCKSVRDMPANPGNDCGR
jgi:hypothetical protein